MIIFGIFIVLIKKVRCGFLILVRVVNIKLNKFCVDRWVMFFIRFSVFSVFVCWDREYILVMIFLVVGVDLDVSGSRNVVRNICYFLVVKVVYIVSILFIIRLICKKYRLNLVFLFFLIGFVFIGFCLVKDLIGVLNFFGVVVRWVVFLWLLLWLWCCCVFGCCVMY